MLPLVNCGLHIILDPIDGDVCLTRGPLVHLMCTTLDNARANVMYVTDRSVLTLEYKTYDACRYYPPF